MKDPHETSIAADKVKDSQGGQPSRNPNFAKWLRRSGYICLLMFFGWTVLYSQRCGSLYRAGAEEEAVRWISFGRQVSGVLLKITLGLIGIGIFMPVAERIRRKRFNARNR